MFFFQVFVVLFNPSLRSAVLVRPEMIDSLFGSVKMDFLLLLVVDLRSNNELIS